MDKSKWDRMRRVNGFTTVTTTSGQLVGPHPGRVALIVSTPVPNLDVQLSDGTLTSGASTATTGVKSSYTVPAGVQALLTSATMFGTTGTTQVCALQLVRGATTINLAQFTGSGIWTGQILLRAGDTVQWNCTTAVAASVTDFSINATKDNPPGRVTLNFQDSVLGDQGIQLYPGNAPLYLDSECVGCALQEGVSAIASAGSLTVGWTDFFQS